MRLTVAIFVIFSCPKGSSIGDEVTGGAGAAGAVLSKSREVPGKCRGSLGKGRGGLGKCWGRMGKCGRRRKMTENDGK